MVVRLLILLGVIIGVGAFSAWWNKREGRFSEATGRFERTELGLARAARPSAVLVEFYGENCAPCVVVERRVNALVGEVPDVEVVKIDAGDHLDLADRYNVRRVPTLFVTDGDLKIIWRASGVPSEDAIKRALLGPDWAGRPHPENAEHPV